MSSPHLAAMPGLGQRLGSPAGAPCPGAPALRLYLYDGVAQPWFSARRVEDYLHAWLPWVQTDVRGDLLAWALGEIPQTPCRQAAQAAVAERLCRSRVLDPTREACDQARRTLKPELEFEARLLASGARASAGVLYDGAGVQSLAFSLLTREERGPGALHVWFTERLFATRDEAGQRYHARVSLYGLPSLVSSSGMVEAPARGREEYFARRLGVSPGGAGAEDGATRLLHEDPRMTEIAKGYAMQAVFYGLTGEPFCDDPKCRLFNAHWQREMLAAQLDGGEFCGRHRQTLQAWRLGWS